MSCQGHLTVYAAQFTINSANADYRKWITCQCYCPKCNMRHYCFRPEYFIEQDFEGAFIPWCCQRQT